MRLSKYIIVLYLLLLALPVSGVGWFLFTPAGAAAVLGAISRFSPVQIEAAEVHGRLAGAVRLVDVTVRWPEGEAEAEELLFRWHPLPVLLGSLVIEELRVHGGVAQLRGEKEASPANDFTFPEIGGFPLRLQAEIERLQVDGFAVRRPSGEILQVAHLHGAVAWEAGRLRVERLEFAGSPGRLAGNVTADFVAPALAVDLQVVPAGGLGKFDTLIIRTDLQPAAGRRQMVGALSLAVRGGEEDRVRLQSAIDWRPDRIALSDLYLVRPGTEGEVRGEGAILAGEGWSFDLSLHLAGFDLHAETGIHTSLFGRLTAEGDRERWQGRFNFDNRVGGWQKGGLAGTFAGNPTGITLADMQGTWLQGSLRGQLAIDWDDDWQIEAVLAARNLQPATVVAEWPGRINFDLQGTANWGERLPTAASVRGTLHDSTLRGRALTGGIVASMQGEDVRLDRLALRGDGFDLHAEGKLQEKIGFRLDIFRLGAVIPETAGKLHVNGWINRRAGGLRGRFTAQGESVVWRELRLRRGSLRAERTEDATPFAVESQLQGLVWRHYLLAGVTLRAQGSLPEHRIRLITTGADLQLNMTVRGEYSDRTWQGQLLALKTGGALAGNWALRQPASLQLGGNRLQTSPLRLAGEGKEFVGIAGDLRLLPLQGWLTAEWRHLNLARANPWIGNMLLTGRSSGSGRIAWLPGDFLDLRGDLTAAGSFTRNGEQLQVRQSVAQIVWNSGGLKGKLEAELAASGIIALAFESPRPASAEWPQAGAFAAKWRIPDLSPLSPWLPEIDLTGSSSGVVRGRWLENGIELAGEAEMAGRVARETLQLEIRRAHAAFAWGEKGLQSDWQIDLVEQGRIAGRVTSDEPARRQIPARGEIRIGWKKIDLAFLRPWIRRDLLLIGSLSGEAQGEWFPDRRLRLAGESRIDDGELQWRDEAGVVTAGVQQGRVRWDWQEEALAGELQLQLENFGRAEGSFRLPVAARWPVAIETAGPVQARLSADLQEEGLLKAFFPGLVQETRGKLRLDLRLGGSWENPAFGGDVHLHDASAFLPAAGIRVEQVEVKGTFDGQDIRIGFLQLRSGAGHIAGEGRLRLNQWRLDTYQFHLQGENFQAVHLPELQVQVSPDLRFSGTMERMILRGDLRVPRLLIAGRELAAPIRPSSDIVIVDAPQATGRKLPLAVDIRVQVVLGEHVLVKTEGIDARLEGRALLTMTGFDPQTITGQGEIRVAQGKYSAYGVSLDITRGNILFAGGPVARPALDILALRTVGEVKAGVKVTGTPDHPRVALFSEPPMADTDTLAYMILGHPISHEGGSNVGLLMFAANTLLSKGESAVLQDRLKRIFGLDVLEVSAGKGEVQQSQITIGKYLNPDLYISFGQSLFTPSSEVRMRYNLSRRWQIESSVGEESAVDLYYKIEFR